MVKSKFSKYVLPAVACSFMLAACGDDSSSSSKNVEESTTISDKAISGVSQKGPFVTGSSVKVFELDNNYKQTGKSFTGKIEKDDGYFAIESVELASQFAVLEASGYYRNEVTGEKSSGTITLNAITDLSEREKVNVNLLTHLEYDRAMYLVKNDTLTVAEAKEQAEKEIFKAFGIEGDFANSEDLDIFSKGEGNAALLAISVMMQADRSEAELTELLTRFANDIKEDGSWDDAAAKTKVADWAMLANTSGILDSISKNIAAWELGEVPEFADYVYKYWTSIYDLKACDKDAEGSVIEVENKESENYGTDVRLICKSEKWTTASDLEKDTYGWEAPSGTLGANLRKAGDLTKAIYVYDSKAKAWREPNIVEMKKTYTKGVDSTTVPGYFFTTGGAYNVEVCDEVLQGSVIYVGKKLVAGDKSGFFCNKKHFSTNNKSQWGFATEEELPVISENGGFEENYDGTIFCDLDIYVCDDFEWKLTKDTVAAILKEEHLESFESDGGVYFSRRSLLWVKHDAKQGWDLASQSDAEMSKMVYGDEVDVIIPGVYRYNPAKGNEQITLKEAEGDFIADGWSVDMGLLSAHGFLQQPGCTIERKGEIVYVNKNEPYQWIKNFKICDVNPKWTSRSAGVETVSDTMWGEWENFDHWYDNMGSVCDKDHLGETRYGTQSKIIEYRCVEAPDAKYNDFSEEQKKTFVDGYTWTAIGFIGQEMIDLQDSPCTKANLGEELRGTASNYWLYTCSTLDGMSDPVWVKSERQDKFYVHSYGYGWN